jgi:hypothetical protein
VKLYIEPDTKAKNARSEFKEAGWTQTQDGYQLCPSCSKEGTE